MAHDHGNAANSAARAAEELSGEQGHLPLITGIKMGRLMTMRLPSSAQVILFASTIINHH